MKINEFFIVKNNGKQLVKLKIHYIKNVTIAYVIKKQRKHKIFYVHSAIWTEF